MVPNDGSGRLLVVSNRLPVTARRGRDGAWTASRSSGGLITALEPVLEERGGTWIGWPGVGVDELPEISELLADQSQTIGYRLQGVGLSEEEEEDFYRGFSNQVIWPLFHDFQTQCNFDPRFWEAYRRVNRRFADAVRAEARDEDFIWIHDYHLMGVAERLRVDGVTGRIGFFLHIPFPPLDLFLKLPWRNQILRSLLQFDLLGFQSARDRENFLHTLSLLVPDVEIEGRGRRVATVRTEQRTIRVGTFPIAIDVDDFQGLASSNQVSERVAALWTDFAGKQIILGVDRLDYSKGIPHKLQGYRLALERYPDLQERVSLVQLVIPSREDIPEYEAIRREVERLVGQISGEFTRPGWVPIHYQYGRWDRPELIAHYRAASVGLVTALKDGMNLVAKEFCACSIEDEGVLVLSEYAGATAQLQTDALLVNPYDVEGVAEAIHRACTMSDRERRQRMRSMRNKIRREDIHWWVDIFLKAARDEDLGDFTMLEAYRPPTLESLEPTSEE